MTAGRHPGVMSWTPWSIVSVGPKHQAEGSRSKGLTAATHLKKKNRANWTKVQIFHNASR